MVGRVSSLTEQKLLNIELFLSLKMNFNYLKKFIINLTREQIGNKRGGGGEGEKQKSLPNVCKLVLPTYAVLPRYTRRI